MMKKMLQRFSLRVFAALVLSLMLVCGLAICGFAADSASFETVRYETQTSYDSSNSAYGGASGSTMTYGQRIGLGFLTGAVVAGVFCFFCVRQLKTAVRQHSASDYVAGNGLHLTDRRDLYLYSNTVRIPRQNQGGGRGGGRGGMGMGMGMSGPGGPRGGGFGGPGGGGPRGGGGRR